MLSRSAVSHLPPKKTNALPLLNLRCAFAIKQMLKDVSDPNVRHKELSRIDKSIFNNASAQLCKLRKDFKCFMILLLHQWYKINYESDLSFIILYCTCNSKHFIVKFIWLLAIRQFIFLTIAMNKTHLWLSIVSKMVFLNSVSKKLLAFTLSF